MSFWNDLGKDLARYPGPGLRRLRSALSSPGFWAVANYRVGRALNALPRWAGLGPKLLHRPFSIAVMLATGAEIPATASIGPGLYVGHFGGIVLSGDCVLGESCNLSQGVTIGFGERRGKGGVPVIGDRVYVAPGAKVFGPIRVGDDSAIGANAVVNADVPAGASVAGIPARVVSNKGSRGHIEIRDLKLPREGPPAPPPVTSSRH